MEDVHSKKPTQIDAISSLFKSKRLLIIQVISMFTFFASALASWKMLSYTLDTPTPVVVILTYASFVVSHAVAARCSPNTEEATSS